MCFYQNAVFLGLDTNIGMGCWEFKSEALQLTLKTGKMFQVWITGKERSRADSALLFACEIKVKVFNMCGSKKGEKRYLKLRMDRSRIFQLLYNVVIMASAQYQSYSQPSTTLFKWFVLVGVFSARCKSSRLLHTPVLQLYSFFLFLISLCFTLSAEWSWIPIELTRTFHTKNFPKWT